MLALAVLQPSLRFDDHAALAAADDDDRQPRRQCSRGQEGYQYRSFRLYAAARRWRLRRGEAVPELLETNGGTIRKPGDQLQLAAHCLISSATSSRARASIFARSAWGSEATTSFSVRGIPTLMSFPCLAPFPPSDVATLGHHR